MYICMYRDKYVQSHLLKPTEWSIYSKPVSKLNDKKTKVTFSFNRKKLISSNLGSYIQIKTYELYPASVIPLKSLSHSSTSPTTITYFSHPPYNIQIIILGSFFFFFLILIFCISSSCQATYIRLSSFFLIPYFKNSIQRRHFS